MVCPTLNMLNMRYIIYNPEQAPIRNPFAYGNAWFAKRWRWWTMPMPDGRNESVQPVDGGGCRQTFCCRSGRFHSSTGFYGNDCTYRLQTECGLYQSNTKTEQLAIFSEIYYQPGWKAFVDGKETPLFPCRLDITRLRVPAGEHQIVFRFEPDNYIMATQDCIGKLAAYPVAAGRAIAWSVWNTLKKDKELQK